MISDDLVDARKRRPRIYGFRTFADPGCPLDFAGAFRDNIREFVRECAEFEDRSFEGMTAWCTLLVDEKTGAVIPLYVVEDDVSLSPHPLCDHCRCAGESKKLPTLGFSSCFSVNVVEHCGRMEPSFRVQEALPFHYSRGR